MCLDIVDFLEKLLCFSPWWLFHWQTSESQPTVATTSWKTNLQDFLFFRYCLRNTTCSLKCCKVLSYWILIMETREKDCKQIAMYTACLLKCLSSVWHQNKSRDQFCLMACFFHLLLTRLNTLSSHGRGKIHFTTVQFCDLAIVCYQHYFNNTPWLLVLYSIFQGGGSFTVQDCWPCTHKYRQAKL